MQQSTYRALKYTAVFLAMPLIGLFIYGLMHYFVYVLPLSGKSSTWMYTFYTLLIIAFGLAAGYWMLKAAFHAAHIREGEPELRLRDLPKHQPKAGPENT